MKKKIILFALPIMTVFITTASAEDSQTTWTTGRYTNNANLNKTLTIPNATKLTVTITGETEHNYDYITIKDKNGKIVQKYLSGKINKTFEVSGDSITANLKSDASITKSGVTVSIKSNNISGEKPGLILNPKKGTVLEHTGVHFEVAKGVTKLYYKYYDMKMPIKGNYLRYIDTVVEHNITVCAEKQDGIPSCRTYEVEKYNPFNASFTTNQGNSTILAFKNAEVAYLYHSSADDSEWNNINELNHYKFYWTRNVKGETSINSYKDNYLGHYTLLLCGDKSSKWVCESIFMYSTEM